MLAIASIVTLFVACDDDDDDPSFAAPEIEAVSSELSQIPGETASIQLAVSAEAGISSIAVSGAATGDVQFEADDNTQVVGYDFDVPQDAAEGTQYQFTFTLTDKQSRTATAAVTVTASSTPSLTITINTGENGLADMATVDADGWDGATQTYTLTANNTYILDGFVFVHEGQTIRIEPGTVIKGKPGQGGGASALIVSRGGRIMAEGTAEAPIIMTGLADDLNGSVPDDAEALWGGLIILGNAPTNNNAEGGVKAIEGLPTDGLDGDPMYGGDDADDNSGVVRYVSIRHGGSLIGGDNEINALTLGGVGRGTTLEYIEVWSNLDDGVEWFGGTAQIKYLVSSWIGDDAFDYDEGFSGKVQFALVLSNNANVKDDSWGGEHDGGVGNNEGNAPYAKPQFYNISYLGDEGLLGTIVFRDNAGGEYHNSIFANYEKGVSVELRQDIESSYDRLVAGDLKLENNLWFNVADGTPAGIFEIITAGTITTPAEVDEARADFEMYFSDAGNTVADPELNGVVPAANAAVTTGLSTPSDDFFEAVNYKGAFAPGEEPWIAGWTKTWEVLNQ